MSSGPVDLLVIVSGRAFPASKAALSAHSDYFRAVLGHMGTEDRHLVLPTMIPSDYFSLLLSSLQSPVGLAPLLTQDNVYQVLLYAQLLQMPAAVAQCKAFLASLHQESAAAASSQQQHLLLASSSVSIARPVASKLLPDEMSQQQQIWRPYWSQLFQQKEEPQWGHHHHLYPYVRRPPVVVLSSSHESPANDAVKNPTVRDAASEDVVGDASLDHKGSLVHLDIAACDGPVQFHRVSNSLDLAVPAELSGEKEQGEEEGNNSSSELFQCLFCNHVFKSHYCYQKHKRRHLNPFAVDRHEVATLGPEKRTLVLKDNNVQFFPCKICGAKFPSYYFVHKHKKMWHADLMGDEDAEGDAQNASSSTESRQELLPKGRTEDGNLPEEKLSGEWKRPQEATVKSELIIP